MEHISIATDSLVCLNILYKYLHKFQCDKSNVDKQMHKSSDSLCRNRVKVQGRRHYL